MHYLNISSDKSNEVPVFESDGAVKSQTISFPQRTAAKAEFVAEDKIVPVTGFTKAMVKSMTESMVNITYFITDFTNHMA